VIAACVEESSPMKRGLKLFLSVSNDRPVYVEESSPMKRGLKLFLSVSNDRPVYVEESSPMKRGLKREVVGVEQRCWVVEESSPMKRGTETQIRAHLRKSAARRREFPVEERTETRSPRRAAQTSVCDVCDMLMPLEAEVESLHASAGAFLRPQSSSLRDHQHRTGFRIRDSGSERPDSR